MNKVRIGNSEYSVILWVVSIMPIVFILFMNPPLITYVFIFISIIMGLFAILWMPTLISKYSLRPAIDKAKANETTWCRVTKDRILAPQFVDKGPYGQNKGVTYKAKADIIDDGSFPIKWLNGNPCVLMYDLLNVNINLEKSVARKLMQKTYGIRSGIDGYKKAKQDKEVLFK